MDPHDTSKYAKLGAMDTKCGALLQLTSLLLVFISLSSVQQRLLSSAEGLYKTLVIALLSSCLLQLYVLWFKERPSDAFVRHRKWIFNAAVALTAAACLLVAVLVLQALVS